MAWFLHGMVFVYSKRYANKYELYYRINNNIIVDERIPLI